MRVDNSFGNVGTCGPVAAFSLTEGRESRRPPTDTTGAAGAPDSFGRPFVMPPLAVVLTGMSRLHRTACVKAVQDALQQAVAARACVQTEHMGEER